MRMEALCPGKGTAATPAMGLFRIWYRYRCPRNAHDQPILNAFLHCKRKHTVVAGRRGYSPYAYVTKPGGFHVKD